MIKMKHLFLAISYLLITACGGAEEPPAAPSSVIGKAFNMTVLTGAGGHPTSGSYTITIISSSTYSTSGSRSSTGTYVYSAKDEIGTAAIDDSDLGIAGIFLTYSSKSSGTFLVADVTDAKNKYHTGTFSSN